MNILPLRSKKPLNKEILEDHKDIQLLDPKLVAGREHIEFAASQAEKAFKRNENISNDPLIEIMVRMSGQRQISKAFEMFGLNDSKKAVLISKKEVRDLLKNNGWTIDEQILEIDEEKIERIKESFEITTSELEIASNNSRTDAIVEIVKERVALTTLR